MISVTYSEKRRYAELQISDKVFLNNKEYKINNIKDGGMGKILLCREAETNIGIGNLPQAIAIKGIKHSFFDMIHAKEIFKKELICWSQVNSPNIIPLIGIGSLQQEGEEYVAITETYDGSLRDLINGRVNTDYKKFTLSDKLSILYQISTGLHRLYTTERILHLDLKPDNILFKGPERIYSPCKDSHSFYQYKFDISDLGLSMFKDELSTYQKKVLQRQLTLHETIQIFGTPIYMSPERFKINYIPNEYADVYSLGAIFFELIFEIPYIKEQNDAPYAGYKYLEKRWTDVHHLITKKYGKTELKIIKDILNITLCEIPDRFEIRFLIEILENVCLPVKEVILTEHGDVGYVRDMHTGLTTRGLPYLNPRIQYSDEFSFRAEDLNSIIEEYTNMSSKYPQNKDSLNRIKREIVSDVESQINNNISIGTFSSGSFLFNIRYEYDIRVCIQYGLLEYLEGAKLKATSLIQKTCLGFPRRKERFGKPDLFRKECAKLHQYLYRISPNKGMFLYGSYVEHVLPEILLKGTFEKEYTDHNQNNIIHVLYRSVQSMITNFVSGHTTDLKEGYGEWSKYNNDIAFIAPSNADNSVAFYSTMGAFQGIIFKKETKESFFAKKIYIKEVLPTRYIITSTIETYRKNGNHEEYQKSEEIEEKTEVLLEKSANHRAFLCPLVFSNSNNDALKKAAEWIYS